MKASKSLYPYRILRGSLANPLLLNTSYTILLPPSITSDAVCARASCPSSVNRPPPLASASFHLHLADMGNGSQRALWPTRSEDK